MFPVGGLQKSRVRALAKKFGLPNAQRPDSQGLCFLGDISLEDMLAREAQPRPGSVLDESGAVVGTHKGAVLYTLGQRHGFSLLHDNPHTAAQYVIAKDTRANTITVSPEQFPRGSTTTTIELAHTNWIGEVSGGPCEARFRYRQALIPAQLSQTEGRVVLKKPFYVPQGQSLVLYQGERCLGGGSINNATLGA
jgi:tRNA-specific 2-thiouridylase